VTIWLLVRRKMIRKEKLSVREKSRKKKQKNECTYRKEKK